MTMKRSAAACGADRHAARRGRCRDPARARSNCATRWRPSPRTCRCTSPISPTTTLDQAKVLIESTVAFERETFAAGAADRDGPARGAVATDPARRQGRRHRRRRARRRNALRRHRHYRARRTRAADRRAAHRLAQRQGRRGRRAAQSRSTMPRAACAPSSNCRSTRPGAVRSPRNARRYPSCSNPKSNPCPAACAACCARGRLDGNPRQLARSMPTKWRRPRRWSNSSATCRQFAGELALNEMTLRTYTDLQQYLDSGTARCSTACATPALTDRSFRQSQVDAARRFCAKVFGADYAAAAGQGGGGCRGARAQPGAGLTPYRLRSGPQP